MGTFLQQEVDLYYKDHLLSKSEATSVLSLESLSLRNDDCPSPTEIPEWEDEDTDLEADGGE